MNVAITRLRLALLGLLALFAVVAIDFLARNGQFTRLAPHFAGACRTVLLGASAADIAVDRPRGLAYLAYLERRANAQAKPALGTVMLVDLNAPAPRPRAALSIDPADFRPLALSLYSPPSGPQRLFVISHPQDKFYTVEILEQTSTGAFAPLVSLRDPLLVAPRAIVAVGPRQFYLANESAEGAFSRFVELLLRRARSTITYYDGTSLRRVATGLAAGSGIAASADLAHVYASDAFARRVSVYARDAASGELRLERVVDLGSMPAHLSVDDSGVLWIAAQPKRLAFLRHLRDPAALAPAQVFEVVPGAWQPREVYLNRGEQLSGSSAAARIGDALLIGAVLDHKLLACKSAR
jgi:arylesterase / paraoxonase